MLKRYALEHFLLFLWMEVRSHGMGVFIMCVSWSLYA